MFKRITKSYITVLLAVFSMGTLAAPVLKSGTYEFIMLAVTPDKRVEGYYLEDLSDNVTKKCTFYFSGAVGETSQIAIKTWLDETFTGTLEATEHGIRLKVPHNNEHPGCMNSMYPEIESTEGAEYGLLDDKEWVGLAKVKDRKAYLYENPDKSSKRRSSVVSKDIVGVLKYSGDWVYIEHMTTQNESYKGWVRLTQITALD